MKAVKKVAKVVGVVAAVAAAIPTGGTSLLGLGISAGAFGAIAIGASVVGGLAASASRRKVEPSLAIGNITEFRYQGEAGNPMVLGRSYFAGIPVHRDGYPAGATPTPNPYLSYPVVYSIGPIKGFQQFQADREPVPLSAGAATGKFAGYMWVDSQIGATPETNALAPPFAGIEGWDTSSKLSGLAAALWTFKFDAQDREGRLYANGEPEPGAILEGLLCYDPRKDSTYPGGAGSHRSADPATWEWTANPGILGLQWAIGWRQNGILVGGCGIDIGAIDVASFVECANVCDANGWTCGGVRSTLDGRWNVLKEILQAGGAEPVRSGATLSCIVQTPRVSIATLTQDDVTGRVAPEGSTPRRIRKNSLIPRYVSEDHEWQPVQAKPVTIDAYVTADGRLKQEELPLPLVQDVHQASQLAYYEIVNRRELPMTIDALKPRWIGFRPGDCITAELPDEGHISQPFIVRRRAPNPRTMEVGMEFLTETTAKHAAALSLSGNPPPSPGLTSDDLRTVPTPEAGDWAVVGTTLTSEAGSIPALAATGGVSNTNVSHVIFEYRPTGTTEWILQVVADASVTRQEFPTVTPVTSYEVAVSYVARNGVLSDRRVYGPVVSGWSASSGTTGTALPGYLEKNAGGAGWNREARSTGTYGVGSRIWISFPGTVPGNVMLGWNADPETNASHTSIDAALYLETGTDRLRFRQDGTSVGPALTPAAGDRFYLEIGATDVTAHSADGTLLHTFAGKGGQPLHFDSSFFDDGAAVEGLVIADPAGKAVAVDLVATDITIHDAPPVEGRMHLKTDTGEYWGVRGARWELVSTIGATAAQLALISAAQDAADAAAADADNALGKLDDFENDGLLSKAERRSLYLAINQLAASRMKVRESAAALGALTAELDAEQDAWGGASGFKTYLDGLNPPLSSTSLTPTPISTTTRDTRGQTWQSALGALQKAIDARSAQLAEWSNIANTPGAFGPNLLPEQFRIFTESARAPLLTYSGTGLRVSSGSVENPLLPGVDAYRTFVDAASPAGSNYLIFGTNFDYPTVYLEGGKKYLLYARLRVDAGDNPVRVRTWLQSADNALNFQSEWQTSGADIDIVDEIDLTGVSGQGFTWLYQVQTIDGLAYGSPNGGGFRPFYQGIYEKTGVLNTVPPPDIGDYLRTQILATVKANADETAANAPSLDGPTTVTIKRTAAGVAKSGQLPKTVQFARKVGDTDVSASATWTRTTPGGWTVSIDGDGTLSITAIPAGAPSGQQITVTAAHANNTQTRVLSVNFEDDAAVGGGGGGGASVGINGTVSTSTYSTTLAEFDFEPTATSHPVFANVTYPAGNIGMKIQYATSNPGTWSDVAETDPGQAAFAGSPPEEPGNDGFCNVSGTKAGLTVGVRAYFRVLAKEVAGSDIPVAGSAGAS